MLSDRHHFRLFDVKKYKQLEPVLAKLLNKTIASNDLAILLKEGVSVAESDDFKKYNDISDTRYFVEAFSEILELIDANDFLKWVNTESYELTDQEPKSLFGYLVVLLCCPKFQWFSSDKLPITETTIKYSECLGHFYSCGQNMYSMLNEIGTENLLGDTELMMFNLQQLKRLNTVIAEDYNELCDPNRTLYMILNQEDGSFIEVIMLEQPPAPEQLRGCYAEASPKYHRELLDFYTRMTKLLSLANANPNYTILNEFFV
jgi:hypothetical protein